MSYSVTDRALLTKYNKHYQNIYIRHKQGLIEELYFMNCGTIGLDEATGLTTKVYNICDLAIHIIECKERLQRKIEVFNLANDDFEKALEKVNDYKTLEAISYFQKYGVRKSNKDNYLLNKFKKALAKIHDDRMNDEIIEDEAVNKMSDEIQSFIDYDIQINANETNWTDIYNHLKGKHNTDQKIYKGR